MFHLSYTSKWFTNEVQILYLAFDYCLWNVLCLMDVSCEWVIEEPVYFWFFGGNPAGGETVLLSDYYLTFINLLLWLTVSQITQTGINRSHNTSIYPFNEALSSLNNMPDMFNDVLHRILALFLSSIAIVGVDLCLVCLIDKSIQKYFLLPSLFFA